MAYIHICTPLHEASIMTKYLQKNVPIHGLEPSSNGNYSPSPSVPSKTEAAKILVIFTAKMLVGHLVALFTDMTLSRLTVNTIRKNRKNKRLFENINKQIADVYAKHKDYRPCSADEFMQTSIYNYFMSEFRDKSKKEVAQLLAYKSLDNMFAIVLDDIVPIPGSATLAIPVKMLLTYCGVRGWGLGSLYNMAMEIDGNTLSIGIDFRPSGFLLTNIVLYTFNNENKLIATYLKNPPEHLYQITNKDAEEIMDQYGKDQNLDILRKSIKEGKADE